MDIHAHVQFFCSRTKPPDGETAWWKSRGPSIGWHCVETHSVVVRQLILVILAVSNIQRRIGWTSQFVLACARRSTTEDDTAYTIRKPDYQNEWH